MSTRLSAALVISSTSPWSRATAVTTAGAPVRWETSPVNWPGRWTVIRWGASSEQSTISTSPDFTTGEALLPVFVSPEHRNRAIAQACDLGFIERRKGDGQKIVFGHVA